MKILIIDRSKWRRGGSSNDILHGNTQLLNKQGFMCCLGFFCNQSKIPKKAILNVGTPEEIDIKYRGLIPELVGLDKGFTTNSNLAYSAIDINDVDGYHIDTEREIQLIELFKRHNISVKFINEYSE